jgi:outer membrane protein assembly factor BamE (lipoprotein component of BamABCDE complex)
MPDQDSLAEIKEGVHDKASIEALLGSPSNIGTFEDKTWYYITRRTEKIAFFDEEAKEQQIVAVVFDGSGIVEEVRRYDLADGREIDPVGRTTPTRGKELSILQQLLGNIGRFNTAEGQ